MVRRSKVRTKWPLSDALATRAVWKVQVLCLNQALLRLRYQS